MAVLDLRPAKLDLKLYRTSSATIRLPFRTADGSPVNIEGRTFVAKAERLDATAIVFATATEKSDAALAFKDQLVVTIDVADAAALDRVGSWDLQQTIGVAEPVTLIAGNVTVAPDQAGP